MFSELDVDKMTHFFTSKCDSIFSEFIPNKTITCENRDPPWITTSLKSAIKCKRRVYNKYVKRGCKPDDWEYVCTVRNQTSSKITRAKVLLQLRKETIWSISWHQVLLDHFEQNHQQEKVFQYIPPLLENGVFVTNFQTKAKIFNNHFVRQCLLISNDSVLPNPVSRCKSSVQCRNYWRKNFKRYKFIRSQDSPRLGWHID